LHEDVDDDGAGAGRVMECVHQNLYMRSGLRMPAGSNASLSRLWILRMGALSGWNTPTLRAPPRKSVAWPPARSAVERTASGSASPLTQRNPPPHSTSGANGSA